MKGTYLGEFEEVVLLAVAILGEEAYGAAVVAELETQLNRSVSLGGVHTSLNRLEEKGLVRSELGGASAVRGGRSKRYFRLTIPGINALAEIREIRNRMWSLIPKTS